VKESKGGTKVLKDIDKNFTRSNTSIISIQTTLTVAANAPLREGSTRKPLAPWIASSRNFKTDQVKERRGGKTPLRAQRESNHIRKAGSYKEKL